MEKTKLKKTRTMHLTNSSDYYQSWTPEPARRRYKYDVGRNDSPRSFYDPRTQTFFDSRQYQPPRKSHYSCPKRQMDNKDWSQAVFKGPDPAAPHLKYGMFANNRRSAPSRLPYGPRRPSVKSHYTIPQASSPSYQGRQPSQELPKVKYPRKKHNHKKTTGENLCIYGNSSMLHSRHLSLSEIMHIDIKPRKNHHVPPVPNYDRKMVSSKLTSTPSMSPR